MPDFKQTQEMNQALSDAQELAYQMYIYEDAVELAGDLLEKQKDSNKNEALKGV